MNDFELWEDVFTFSPYETRLPIGVPTPKYGLIDLRALFHFPDILVMSNSSGTRWYAGGRESYIETKGTFSGRQPAGFYSTGDSIEAAAKQYFIHKGILQKGNK